MKLLQKTDSLKTGYLGTRLSGVMGKYTIKKNYGKRCENFHKQWGEPALRPG